MTEQQVNTIKPVKPKKPFYKKWWVWLLAVIVIGALLNPSEEEVATDEPVVEDVAKEETEPVAEEKVEPVVEEVAPVEEKKVEPVVEKKEEPKFSLSQQNAIRKAEDYLDYTAFSKSGLIEQLEFEGFPTDEATFAVNNIQVDWKEQAGLKAKDYLEYTSFSRSGLIEQLEFEGFTSEEATYGADQVGI